MLDWWAHNGPPVYVPVASYFGLIKPQQSSSSNTVAKKESGNLNELLEMAGPGGMFN